MAIERNHNEQQRGIGVNDTFIVNYSSTENSGRLLHESKSDPALLAAQEARGIETRYVPSRFNDSRGEAGTKMNKSALESMTKGGQKQKLLDSLAWVHNKLTEEQPVKQVKDTEVATFAIVAEALPSYLMLRAENPVDITAVPEEVGSVYKASLGMKAHALTRIIEGNAGVIKNSRE
jgi:hypothetical protein